MDVMSKQQKQWTRLEKAIATACTILTVAVLILGFTGIYITIVPPLRAFWHWFAPEYMILGEGSFALAFLGWLLLDMRGRPPRRIRGFILGYLLLFATATLTLSIALSLRSVPDLVSHIGGCAAFFGGGFLAKALVQQLAKDPAARELDQAQDDARQHAADLLRDRKGVAWRLCPSVPSLLRRQVIHGRFPAVVQVTVLTADAAQWEPAVEAWVVRGLTRGDKVAADEKRERRQIERQADVPVTGQQTGQQTGHGGGQNGARKPVSDRDRRHAIVRRLLASDPVPTYAVIAERAGVSVKTVSRIKNERPALRVAGTR